MLFYNSWCWNQILNSKLKKDVNSKIDSKSIWVSPEIKLSCEFVRKSLVSRLKNRFKKILIIKQMWIYV